MTWVFSSDGVTPGNERASLPRDMQRHPQTGEWTTITADNAAEFGYYPVLEVAQPDRDHVRTVESNVPNVDFIEVWTFSQELADANQKADNEQASRDESQRYADWFLSAADRIAGWPVADTSTELMQQHDQQKRVVERLCRWAAQRIVGAGYDGDDQEAPPPEPAMVSLDVSDLVKLFKEN